MKLLEPGVHFVTGNIAVAEAALIAGCRFYAGYPITPSSDLMHHMARRMIEVGGVFIQAEDEIAAINMVLGASAAGMKAMTATSGPGLSLMEEGLDLGFMLELPAVVVDVQRVGPSTGIPTLGSQGDVMQAIWGSHGDKTRVVIAPSNVQESFDLTIHAFNVAEMLRMPVILLSDEFIAHSYGKLRVPTLDEISIVDRVRADPSKHREPFRVDDAVPPFMEPGRGFRAHYTGLIHDERGYPVIDREVTRKLLNRLVREKVAKYRNQVLRYEIYNPLSIDRAEAIIVAYGSIGSICKAVLRRTDLSRRALLFRPITLWPPPDRELIEAIDKFGASKVIVVEMNCGQYVHHVASWVRDMEVSIRFVEFVPGFYPSINEMYRSISKVMNGGKA